MPGIDPARSFVPVRIAVLTVSDTRTSADDTSGDLLAARVQAAGHHLAARRIVTDDRAALAAAFRAWVDDPGVDVVIATGGTGITGRDVTPEAVEDLGGRIIPGFGELFRWISFRSVGTSTIQSRAIASVVDGTLIFALPGSNGGVKDGWDEILVHQLDSRHRPCNFVELLPRLRER